MEEGSTTPTEINKRKRLSSTPNDSESPTKLQALSSLSILSPSPLRRKRASLESSVDDELVDSEALLNDTQIAINILSSQFPKSDIMTPTNPFFKKIKQQTSKKNLDEILIQPVILKTQLYSMVKNRTDTDRELDSLKRSNKIRIFRLVTSQDEYGIMKTEDFMQRINEATSKYLSKSSDKTNESIFQRFTEKLVPHFFEVSINKNMLQQYLYPENESHDIENDITVLMNAGLLLLRDIDTFWLAIPDAGIFLKNVIKGRKEIQSLFNRQKWKEILASDLEAKKLNKSVLGITFHIRDLIGQGKIDCISTTAGTLYRLK